MAPLFDSIARPLVVFHALGAFVLVGASVHLAVVAAKSARGGPIRLAVIRVYARLIGASYALTFGLGLAAYPAYRYRVRGLFLDRYEPWASNLFDIKEGFAAFGLPLAIALFAVPSQLDAEDRRVMPLLATLSVALGVLVVVSMVLGLVVTTVKGV